MKKLLLLTSMIFLSLIANDQKYLKELPGRVEIIKKEIKEKVANAIHENGLPENETISSVMRSGFEDSSKEILFQAKVALEEETFFSDLNIEMDFVFGALSSYNEATTGSKVFYYNDFQSENPWERLCEERRKDKEAYISNMFSCFKPQNTK
jgi:hypothetical protein